jgi:putative aldouronate transport system permease protein
MANPKVFRNELAPGLKAINWVLLTLVFFTMIIPMLNVLAVSLSTKLGSMQPGVVLWPREWSVEGYVTIWSRANLSRAFTNSSFVSVTATFIQVVLSSLAGYVLVQKDLPLRKTLSSIILFTMMIPGDLTLISIYSLNKQMGLLNSYTGLIINGLVSGFSILLMRNYFLSVPESLAESGRIDNATEMQILFRIYVPLSIPGLAAITFLEFIGKWNALMLPVTIITDAKLYTLPMILKQLAFADDGTSGIAIIAPNAQMAAILISVIPLILLYTLAQRFLIGGLTLGASKG